MSTRTWQRGVCRLCSIMLRIVEKRLAPAEPVNDGKQTPMRGHPVLIAQHATATCCRSCLAKWHGIPAGRLLDAAEQRHVVEAIRSEEHTSEHQSLMRTSYAVLRLKQKQ